MFSAITCGFSKYLAWWEPKETVVRGNTDKVTQERRKRETMASYSEITLKAQSHKNQTVKAKPLALEAVLTTTLGRSL